MIFRDTPLAGLLSRSIVVMDEQGAIIHTEQVSETIDELDYAVTAAVLQVFERLSFIT